MYVFNVYRARRVPIGVGGGVGWGGPPHHQQKMGRGSLSPPRTKRKPNQRKKQNPPPDLAGLASIVLTNLPPDPSGPTLLNQPTSGSIGPSICCLSDLTLDLSGPASIGYPAKLRFYRARHLLFNRPSSGSVRPGIFCLTDLTPDLSGPASIVYLT